MNEQAQTGVGLKIAKQIKTTVNHYFNGFGNIFADLPDPRQRKTYSIQEIAQGGLSLFLLKQDSRNAFNNDRKEATFKSNFKKLFNGKLPHQDTVKDVFCNLSPVLLESVKKEMIKTLIKDKVLAKYRYHGKYLIAIDATGINSYSDEKEGCTSKTSKNGVTTYTHHVLEAKLICPSGLALSIANEWISNEGKTQYDKQDCERAAFIRLINKIKRDYPRLPIILVADGLYPYAGFFEVCKANSWDYIVTLQDNSLKTVQETIADEKLVQLNNKRRFETQDKTHWYRQDYAWIQNISYHQETMNWIECRDTTTCLSDGNQTVKRFVYLTSLAIDAQNCHTISGLGRLRQKIENEGFNDQKNWGYNLEHKFVRESLNAKKNYYQCLQIAHIINQLVVHSSTIQQILRSDRKLTIKYLWKRLISFLLEGKLSDNLDIAKRIQIRLE